MNYSLRRENFTSLAPAWRKLLEAVPGHSIFQTPGWQLRWWCRFGGGKELELLALRRNQELVALAPLMRRNDALALLGGGDVCDYLDFVILPGEEHLAYEAFLNYLEPLPRGGLELRSLPEGSPTLSHLTSLAQERGYGVRVEQEDVCPRLELPPSFEDYLAALPKKDRHELRRKMRRLAASGQVTYYLARDPARLSQDLDDFFRLHRDSREDKRAFMSDEMERFFRSQAAWLQDEGVLRLYFLEVDGVRVSSVICFDYGGEFLLYNSGYDLAYSSLSVGLLLKAFCLREAIELGRGAFDFLRGDEPYKYDLGGKDRALYCCLITAQPEEGPSP